MTMQDLYKGFKKVAEDDLKATLRHENGHELNIAKSGLSKKQKVQLEKLPLHQAEGTSNTDAFQKLQSEMENVKLGAEPSQEPQMSGIPFQPTEAQLSAQQPSVGYKIGQSLSKVVTPITEPLVGMVEGYKTLGKQAGDKLSQVGEAAGEVAKEIGAGIVGAPMPQKTKSKIGTQPEQERQLTETQREAESLLSQDEMASAKELGLLPQDDATQKPTLSPKAAIPPEPDQVLQQQAATKPEITKRAVDLTRPLNAPTIIRTPEEVILDPSVNETERAQALVLAAQNIQSKIERANLDFQEEMRKPENQINVDRFYSNMSTGRKIRTIIGMLLGGMAGGILRQENPLIAMLNKEIDRDIEAQKMAREDKTNLYKQNLAVLKDSHAAYLQTANQLRSIVEMKMNDAKMKLDPKNLLAKSAIDAALSENKRKTIENNQAIANAELTQRFERAKQQGQLLEIPDRLDKNLDSAVRLTDNKGRSVKYYARNKSAVSELQKKADAISNAENVLKRIYQFNKQYGREVGFLGIDTPGYDTAQALNQEAKIAMVNLLSSGTLTERNAKLFDNLMPTAGAWKQDDAQRLLINATKTLLDQKKTLIQNNLMR